MLLSSIRLPAVVRAGDRFRHGAGVWPTSASATWGLPRSDGGIAAHDASVRASLQERRDGEHASRNRVESRRWQLAREVAGDRVDLGRLEPAVRV
jgi:hypothetical protein